jgi:histidinol-phosphatase (PHP family)
MQGQSVPWKVSLHGGHSGEFCDHADGTLRELLEAAAQAGYTTFGVSEHVPRHAEWFLYNEEKARGWTLQRTIDNFEQYQRVLTPLAKEFSDRLVVLRGFEAEVVPTDSYVQLMRRYRSRRQADGTPVFDYFVGSVHYVKERIIDGSPELFAQATEALGGLERLSILYYETLGEMVEALRPDVVGHFDLIKRNVALAGLNLADTTTDRVRAAAVRALESVRANNAILDLNTAGWRKGLGEPYPAPWLVRQAAEMGIGFCFGDDSHRVSDVGAGLEEARNYLLSHSVQTITILTREGDPVTGTLVRKIVSLQ